MYFHDQVKQLYEIGALQLLSKHIPRILFADQLPEDVARIPLLLIVQQEYRSCVTVQEGYALHYFFRHKIPAESIHKTGRTIPWIMTDDIAVLYDEDNDHVQAFSRKAPGVRLVCFLKK